MRQIKKKWNTKMDRRLYRNIPLDYIGTFVANLNMQSSIWVLYLVYCGLNLAQIGLLEGIFHATSIICEVPSGAVADLLGRKRSMILSRVCVAISCIIMLFSRSFWLFALSFAIQALGNNFNSGSEEALLYDSMKGLGIEEKYMRVNGKLNVIIEVSQAIATVAGGILAEYSYFWCYAACLVIAVLALVPVVFMVEAPVEKAENKALSIGRTIAVHFQTSFEIMKSRKEIMKIIVYYAVVFAAETLLFFYSQQYFSDLGYNKIQISFALLILGIASCLGAFASEKIFRKIGKRMVTIATVTIALAFLCYGLKNAVLAAIALALAGFCNSTLYPVQSNALNELIPSQQRATLISVNSMFFSIFMIIMFPLAGILADKWGLAKVFVVLGVLLLTFSLWWKIGGKKQTE